MSIEHETPFSAGDEESLREFLDSLEVPAEPLDLAKKILRRRGRVALSSALTMFAHQNEDDPEVVEDVQATIARQLNDYNQQHRLLRLGDRLAMTGKLYSRLTIPGMMEVRETLEPHQHVTGVFSELVSMSAPPQEYLDQEYPEIFISGHYNYMPAIRMEEMTLTETIGEFTTVRDYPAASMIDVTLYSADMNLQRIYK